MSLYIIEIVISLFFFGMVKKNVVLILITRGEGVVECTLNSNFSTFKFDMNLFDFC